MTDPFALDLTGSLLLAMPGMGDPRFDRSVVFMCAHSDEGAMGLIINKPAEDIDLRDLMDQLDIETQSALPRSAVHIGGPVETARGFVLHSTEYRSRLQTLAVNAAFGMTATLDILEDIALGNGPAQALVALGYAGWGAGQLEAEIARNGWLTVEAHPELVFATADDDKWGAALGALGVDPLGLSGTAGRA